MVDFWPAEARLAQLERLKAGVTTAVTLLGGCDDAYRTDDPACGNAHCEATRESRLRTILAVGPGRRPFPRCFRHVADGSTEDVELEHVNPGYLYLTPASFGWDENELAGKCLGQEFCLRLTDFAQGECLRDERTNFAALDVGDQVFEDLVLLKGAAEQRQILEVERPHVQFDQRTCNRTGRRIAPSAPEHVEEPRPGCSGNEIDDDVDAVMTDCGDEIGTSIHNLVRADGANVIGLRCACDGDDMGASAFRQLNRCRSDATRRAGHEHAFRPHGCPVQQVLGRGVPDRNLGTPGRNRPVFPPRSAKPLPRPRKSFPVSHFRSAGPSGTVAPRPHIRSAFRRLVGGELGDRFPWLLRALA